jgi:hypothetical protein
MSGVRKDTAAMTLKERVSELSLRMRNGETGPSWNELLMLVMELDQYEFVKIQTCEHKRCPKPGLWNAVRCQEEQGRWDEAAPTCSCTCHMQKKCAVMGCEKDADPRNTIHDSRNRRHVVMACEGHGIDAFQNCKGSKRGSHCGCPPAKETIT